MSEIDRVANPVFDMIVRLLTDQALAQSVAESSASRPLSFSTDDLGIMKREVKPLKSMSPAPTRPKVALSNPPSRDWSAFECERELDPQMERVERLSPRQAAAVAVHAMANAGSSSSGAQGAVPSARTPRSVIRSHQALLGMRRKKEFQI